METGDLLQQLHDAQKVLAEIPPGVLGHRLRRERLSQGVSIRDLATKSSVSANSIVRIEGGQNFRATTLVQLCAALGIHLHRLAAPDATGTTAVHKVSDTAWTILDDYAATPMSDAPSKKANLLVLLKSRLSGGKLLPTVIEVNEPSPTRSHPGEEFVYALVGPVGVVVGSQTHVLETDESMEFWGTEPHSYFSVDGVSGKLLSIRVNP